MCLYANNELFVITLYGQSMILINNYLKFYFEIKLLDFTEYSITYLKFIFKFLLQCELWVRSNDLHHMLNIKMQALCYLKTLQLQSTPFFLTCVPKFQYMLHGHCVHVASCALILGFLIGA